MKTYSEKLKDVRWQKKRLEILQRDEWTCQSCFGSEDVSLHVHHRYYTRGADPWDYPDEALITLCESCHEQERDAMAEAEGLLLKALRTHFLAAEMADLAIGFEQMEMVHIPGVVSCAIAGIVGSKENLRVVVARYLDGLRKDSPDA